MTDFLLVLSLGVVIGIMLYRSWTNHIMAEAVRMIEQDAGKSIDEIFDDHANGVTEFKQITCRKYQQQYLVYDSETDEFLSQGTDLENINRALKQKLGKQRFTIWFDLDDAELADHKPGG